MKRTLQTDSATHHRAAAAFALAFAATTITCLAGVLSFDLLTLRLAPAFNLEVLPDSTWPARWLPGAVTAGEQQRAGAEQWLHVVLVFATLTVAIACINALAGLLSHANERRYETALRAIVGASPRQLRAALRRNAFLNAAAGAIVGIPVGLIVAGLIRSTWQSSRAGTPLIWALLALCSTLLITLLAARVSARRLGRKGWMGDALAPAARSIPGWGAEDLRTLLLAAQLACAVAVTTVSLLAWSAVVAASVSAPRAGVQASASYVRLARITLPGHASDAARRAEYQRILSAAAKHDGVVAESLASPGVLLGMGKIDKVISECGRCARANMFTPLFAVETQQHVIGERFFQAAGIALRTGREFDSTTDDRRNVVVNDTFARLAFQGQDPVGKRIMTGGFGGDWYRVIGVVPDIPTVGMRHFEADPLVAGFSTATNAPAVYFSTSAFAPATFDVVVRTRAPAVQLAGFGFAPLTEVLMRAAAPQKSFARMVALLGLMLCGAAATGAFITTVLNVRARQSEIAVRRAVGARRREVWRLLFGSLLKVALQGSAFGVIVAAALSRVVEAFVPGMPAFNFSVALGVSSAFTLIIMVAALPPIREALRIAPARAAQG